MWELGSSHLKVFLLSRNESERPARAGSKTLWGWFPIRIYTISKLFSLRLWILVLFAKFEAWKQPNSSDRTLPWACLALKNCHFLSSEREQNILTQKKDSHKTQLVWLSPRRSYSFCTSLVRPTSLHDSQFLHIQEHGNKWVIYHYILWPFGQRFLASMIQLDTQSQLLLWLGMLQQKS